MSYEAGITPRFQSNGNLRTAILDFLIFLKTSDIKKYERWLFLQENKKKKTLKPQIFLILKTRSGKNRLLLWHQIQWTLIYHTKLFPDKVLKKSQRFVAFVQKLKKVVCLKCILDVSQSFSRFLPSTFVLDRGKFIHILSNERGPVCTFCPGVPWP